MYTLWNKYLQVLILLVKTQNSNIIKLKTLIALKLQII